MSIEVGQYWRMKSTQRTYYIYELEMWASPSSGWVAVSREPKGTTNLAANIELIGEQDPDYFRHWKEHKDILLDEYELITDEGEIGLLHLQRLAWNEGCGGTG